MRLVNLNESGNTDFVAPKANRLFKDPSVKIDTSNDRFTVYHINYLVEGYRLLGLHFKVVIFNHEDMGSHIEGFMMYPGMSEHEAGTSVFDKGTEADVIKNVLNDVTGDFSELSLNVSTDPNQVLSDLLDPSHKMSKVLIKTVNSIQHKLSKVFD